MIGLPAFLIAFFSSMLIAYYRIFSSDKFHSYFFLICFNWILLVYCILYGAIAIGLYAILPSDAVKISGSLSNLSPWLYPVGIGVLTKGVSDLNLFNVRTEGTSIPVGLKTITQPIDKFFEEQLDAVSFKGLKKYIDPYYVKSRSDLGTVRFGNDLAKFKNFVLEELRKYFNSEDRIGRFENSDAFGKVKTSDDVLYLVLREFGKTIFESVFTK